jgi:hypothetical protein
MRIFAISCLLFVLTACAEMYKTGANENNSLEQYREATKDSAKKQHDYARQLTTEIMEKIKGETKGKKYYLTSRVFCRPYTTEAMDLEIKKVESDYLNNIEGKRINVKDNTFESVLKLNESADFNQFERFEIQDVRVLIPYFNISARGVVLKVGDKIDIDWRGTADIYLIGTTDKKRNVILQWALWNGKEIKNRSFASYLNDQSENGHDTLNCLSNVNPVSKYGLSKKEQEAISKRSYFLSMTPKALTFSQGYPSAINNTVVSNGSSSQQWVYSDKKKYFYFRSGKLSSWQD